MHASMLNCCLPTAISTAEQPSEVHIDLNTDVGAEHSGSDLETQLVYP